MTPAFAVPTMKFIEGPNDGDPFTIEATGWHQGPFINMVSAEEAIVAVFLHLPLTGPAPTVGSYAGYVIDDPITRTTLDWVGVKATGSYDSGSYPTSPIQGLHVQWIFQFFFASDATAKIRGGSPFPTGFPAAVADGTSTLMNDYLIGPGPLWSAFGVDLFVQSEMPLGSQSTSVPEPAPLALFGVGLLVAWRLRRRSTQRTHAWTPDFACT